MENLTEKVYECTLAVEAHMICDLLARAGISARVDGEFLAGAGGELPLGSTIRVRVEPARTAEARQVIDEWEKLQPPEPTPPPPRASWKSPLWFVAGLIVGAGLMAYGLRTPSSEDGVDYDGDGDYEITYRYAGRTPVVTEFDRDNDGDIDERWHFDLNGFETSYEADDDFDGRFEMSGKPERGQIAVMKLDQDGDGEPEMLWFSRNGVLERVDIYEESGHRVVARQHYNAGLLVSADFDRDGDGQFERRVEYDRYGEPK